MSLPSNHVLSPDCKAATFLLAAAAATSAMRLDPGAESALGHCAVRSACSATNNWVIFAVPAGKFLDHTLPDFCQPPEKSSAPEMTALRVLHSLP